MRLHPFAAALAACLCFAVPAAGQAPSASPDGAQAPAEAGDAARLDLARRYLELSVGGDLVKATDTLMAQAMAALETDSPEASFMAEQMPAMLETLLERTMEEMAPLYARTFTSEELEALVAFYDSPMGRDITHKTLGIAMEQDAIMQDILGEAMTGFLDKFCRQFDCGAEARAAPTAK